MEPNDDEKRKNPDLTPISDGDARPDQLDEDRVKRRLREKKEDAPDATSERAGDVNDADDLRDER